MSQRVHFLSIHVLFICVEAGVAKHVSSYSYAHRSMEVILLFLVLYFSKTMHVGGQHIRITATKYKSMNGGLLSLKCL